MWHFPLRTYRNKQLKQNNSNYFFSSRHITNVLPPYYLCSLTPGLKGQAATVLCIALSTFLVPSA